MIHIRLPTNGGDKDEEGIHYLLEGGSSSLETAHVTLEE